MSAVQNQMPGPNNAAEPPMGGDDEIQELDNVSSIALLIDDLSHEDPSIKINALSKLTNISQLIGISELFILSFRRSSYT